MENLAVAGDRIQADGLSAATRRRSRTPRVQTIGWDEMTPHQRWIVVSGRATPRIQPPDTICTADEYIAWQMARLTTLEHHGR